MSTKIGKSSCSTRFTRNDSYRQTFLRGKRGLFGTRSLYCCSYCGRLLTRTQMQVDHCIPVEGAKSSRFVRTYIRLVGLFSDKKTREQGINGLWNLVPSCPKCNNKKSDKRGLWVVRGIIGRYLFPACWYAGTAVIAGTFAQYLLTGGGMWSYIAYATSKLGEFLSYLGGIL